MFSAWIPTKYIFCTRSVKSPRRIPHDSVRGGLWGRPCVLLCASAITAICCQKNKNEKKASFYKANRHGLNPSFAFRLNIDTE